MYNKYILFCIICLLSACNDNKYNLNYYYWQLNNSEALNNLNNLGTPYYLHIMDVEWNDNKAFPIPKSLLYTTLDSLNINITPVIYIHNNVFTKIDDNHIDSFSKVITHAYNNFTKKYKINCNAIQIDCDWLESNKDKYFKFLESLKNNSQDVILSSTIRLYPYKYSKKLGVPPVDYGVLMCYNVNNVKDYNIKNAIIDDDVIESYIKNIEYPLPIKVALPIFGWYVLFRDTKYQSIIYNNINWTNDSVLFSNIQDNFYQVKKDTIFKNNYLRKGDVLRNEFPSESTLQSTLQLIKKYLPNTKDIILYHYSEENIDNYESLLQKSFNR